MLQCVWRLLSIFLKHSIPISIPTDGLECPVSQCARGRCFIGCSPRFTSPALLEIGVRHTANDRLVTRNESGEFRLAGGPIPSSVDNILANRYDQGSHSHPLLAPLGWASHWAVRLIYELSCRSRKTLISLAGPNNVTLMILMLMAAVHLTSHDVAYSCVPLPLFHK